MDVYSFAIVMYEVLTENLEPYGKTQFNVEYKVAMNEDFRPQIPSTLGNEYAPYIQLMCECWRHKATERPSFTSILQRIEQM